MPIQTGKMLLVTSDPLTKLSMQQTTALMGLQDRIAFKVTLDDVN